MVGEHQACHFIHQNMGAVGDMQKLATEIDAFVRDLNAKTLAAAIDVDQSDRYMKFTDVLHYDKTKDNTYVPGLWDGTLPMAKTKTHYSQVIQTLKCDILQHIEQLRKKKKFGTFEEFTRRIVELWDAIKYENFVFSFQNVLSVEAYTKLTKIFDGEQWAVKRDVREMIQHEKHEIENELRRPDAQKTLSGLVTDSKSRLAKYIVGVVGGVLERILHYFKCLGCENCNNDVKNRHLLVNYENEFKDEVWSLQKTLMKELDAVLDSLEVKLKADNRIHDLSIEMDDMLKQKVQEAIRRKKENIGEYPFEDVLEKLWAEATGDVLRKARYLEETVDIKAAVQAIITKLLGKSDGQFYVREIEERERMMTSAGQAMEKNDPFKVKGSNHFKLKGMVRRGLNYLKLWPTEQDAKRLQDHANRIIQLTKTLYDPSSSPAGKQFNKKDGEVLVKDILKQIDDIEDKRFKITINFKVDLLIHIERLAVAVFLEMHEQYCKENSPEALLHKKKKTYHDLRLSTETY